MPIFSVTSVKVLQKKKRKNYIKKDTRKRHQKTTGKNDTNLKKCHEDLGLGKISGSLFKMGVSDGKKKKTLLMWHHCFGCEMKFS
jgi:hypothetical protein